MKAIKRICTMLLAMLLMASFSITAFAEEPLDTSFDPYSGAGIDGDGGNGGGNNNNNNNNNTGGGDAGTTSDFNADSDPKIEGSVYAHISSTGGHVVYILENPTEDSGPHRVNLEPGQSYPSTGTPMITYDSNNPLTVTVSADIVSTADNGITAGAFGGNITVKAEDADITAKCDGVTIASDGNNSASVTAGNVTSTNIDGIRIQAGSAYGPGTSTATAKDVSAADTGIYATAYNGGSATVIADSVNAKTTGIDVTAGGDSGAGTVTVTVGNKDEYGNVTGGTVTAGETGISVKTNTDSAGNVSTAEVNVAENVTGTTGIKVESNKGTIGQTTITVGTKDDPDSGTVTGGIDLSDSLISGDNTHITLWKVDGPVTGDSAVIEKVMNYFVRQDTPGDNGTLTISNDVINGSENVLLSVTPDSGYVVDTVYYNEKETIKPDTNGYYYLKALPTGGIMLKATFKPDTPVNPDPPTPTPKPVGPVAVFSYKLSFDLDGGVMPDGKTELEMKCSSGQRITLPEAPTREGFVFAGWQTEVRGKKVVFEAGEKFTVTAAKTFVALWVEE